MALSGRVSEQLSSAMNRYRKVQAPKDVTATRADNEIRVTAVGSVSAYVSWATKVFEERGKQDVKIAATGNALAKAVTVAEVLKLRMKNLHQVTDIGLREIVDMYEPLEEGLDPVTGTRSVPFGEITLSKIPLDPSDKGYQSPVEESGPDAEELLRASRGRGRGRRGKARGKGAVPEEDKENDAAAAWAVDESWNGCTETGKPSGKSARKSAGKICAACGCKCVPNDTDLDVDPWKECWSYDWSHWNYDGRTNVTKAAEPVHVAPRKSHSNKNSW